jgi:hypothetical protein
VYLLHKLFECGVHFRDGGLDLPSSFPFPIPFHFHLPLFGDRQIIRRIFVTLDPYIFEMQSNSPPLHLFNVQCVCFTHEMMWYRPFGLWDCWNRYRTLAKDHMFASPAVSRLWHDSQRLYGVVSLISMELGPRLDSILK